MRNTRPELSITKLQISAKNSQTFSRKRSMYSAVRELLTYAGIGEDHHTVGVGCERLDEGRKVGVPHLHALALRRQLTVNSENNQPDHGALDNCVQDTKQELNIGYGNLR